MNVYMLDRITQGRTILVVSQLLVIGIQITFSVENLITSTFEANLMRNHTMKFSQNLLSKYGQIQEQITVYQKANFIHLNVIPKKSKYMKSILNDTFL